MIAAISRERGVEHLGFYDRSVDQYKFADWLDELREANPKRKICLLMDNLGVHKANTVRDTM